MKVTTDGVAYYERTIQLVRELDDIDSSFGSANAKPMGRIRIDVAAGNRDQRRDSNPPHVPWAVSEDRD